MMHLSVRRLLALSAVVSLMLPSIEPAVAGGTITYMPRSQDSALSADEDRRGESAPLYVPGYGPGETPPLSRDALIALLRKKVRYVFVIFNENHSFDNEFGTFPGANGLYSDGLAPRGPEKTPGFVQSYVDGEGMRHEVRPFRLGPEENGTIVDSVDHSHEGLAHKLGVVGVTATMSGFAQQEYKRAKAGTKLYSAATDAAGRQYANLVMSYIDCDTIPFMWQWANRFVLFDNIFATEDTPSTPNAIAMIAGQAGETQWVKHARADGQPEGVPGPIAGDFSKTKEGHNYDLPKGQTGVTEAVPVLDDPNPYWGSEFDIGHSGAPLSPAEYYGVKPVPPSRPWSGPAPMYVAPNLTFATIPLTAAGKEVIDLMRADRHPETDLADVWRDIPAIAAKGGARLPWRWYENGYDHEPTDIGPDPSHKNYVAHHEGPQYFGYIANNPAELSNLKGENDVFEDIAEGRLPPRGVFYIRGGFHNIWNLPVPIQNRNFPGPLTDEEVRTLQNVKTGDDDHPAYSDRQISEAMAARVIDAIAAKPEVWSQSAIIITYDESDGFYDHVPPRILSFGPDKLPLSRGIRVPLILISPYARSHVVAHAEGDHNAVIATLNAIFDLPALSNLPEEADALTAGNTPRFNQFAPPDFEQTHLGPRDTPSDTTDDLLSAFDIDRLQGKTPPLPASLAEIDPAVVKKLPHYEGRGCERIGIVPEDRRQNIVAAPPAHFNPLPSTLPDHNVPAP